MNGYAFIDAAGCGSTGTVCTTLPTCAVNFDGVGYCKEAGSTFAAARMPRTGLATRSHS